MLELASKGEIPWSGLDGFTTTDNIKKGLTLSPPKCPTWMGEIMEKCWKFEPEKRPTFSELKVEFQEKQKDLLIERLEQIKEEQKDDEGYLRQPI